MNARDRFIEVLRSRGQLRYGEEWVIDANLNAYAHELAEKIRHHDWSATVAGTPCCDDRTDEAADLIDPEVGQ